MAKLKTTAIIDSLRPHMGELIKDAVVSYTGDVAAHSSGLTVNKL